MKQLLARFRYFVATLLFLLTTAMSSGGAVFAATATSPLPYTGQGYPITQQCSAGTDTPAGTMLFIFSYGGNYDPTNVTLHGITVLSQQESGNEMHIFTTYSADLASLEQNVNVTWDGSVGNAQLVISHGCAPVSKTPVTLPAITYEDNCGTDNDTFVIPDDGNGVTYTHTYVNNVLTVTATPDSTHTLTVGTSGFVLNNDGTATFTHTFTYDDACTTTVQTEAPVVKTDECGTDNDVFHVPAVTGVVYKVGDTVVSGDVPTGGALSVTVHAYPANSSYTLTGDTEWTLTFTNEECGCGCNEDQDVTATAPTFVDVCGVDHDKYVIPHKEGVYYTVNGTRTDAGTYYPKSATTITVVAHAEDGYKLTGTVEDNTWTKTFTDVPCVVKVRPPKVMFNDLCGVDNDTFTIPSRNGIEYEVNGSVLAAGTYKGNDYAVNGTVTVTAVAKSGYALKGKNHTWSYTFTNESCGGQGGETPATPGAVSFTDVCATANDTYTIPATVGVVYKVNGTVAAAGTYQASGTVNVTAEAASGYVLASGATTSWSHVFTNESCGQVLGESTVVFTPTPGKGAVAAAELANTGQNSLASAIVAFVIATSAILVYAFSPRRQLGN